MIRVAENSDRTVSRRGFFVEAARIVGIAGAAGALGAVAIAGQRENFVWQIDPEKCIACGNCATACVLTPSAAKCVHDVEICGFCDLCFGFFAEQRPGDTEEVVNERCPTNAIIRNLVEEPYYEYMIDEPKCIGCAVCVEGCMQYGNGSLIMQVRHDRCVNCNECAIAAQCPADAFVRVPADEPYLLKSARLEKEEAEEAEEAQVGPQPAEPRPPRPSEVAPERPSPLQTPEEAGAPPVEAPPATDRPAAQTPPEERADSLRDIIGGDLR